MNARFLLCDIGNTSTKLGLADKTGLISTYVFPGGNVETSDSLGLGMIAAIQHAGVCAADIQACVVSSVNPGMDSLVMSASQRYFDCPALFVGRDLSVPLINHYPRPQEVGADILVGAYEARKLFPEAKSLVVADFGTAATFACVEGDAFNGGLIFPGPGTAMKALAMHTAILSQVRLEYPGPEPDPCKDTMTSIQHGLLFGYGAMTEGLCARLKNRLEKPVLTVATGGFSELVSRLGDIFDAIVPTLILDGLFRIYMGSRENQL